MIRVNEHDVNRVIDWASRNEATMREIIRAAMRVAIADTFERAARIVETQSHRRPAAVAKLLRQQKEN